MKEFKDVSLSEFSRADLHVHTTGSDGLKSPKYMVNLANQLGLSAIAITDHEIISSAVEAKKYCLDQGYPLEVVIGSEITTKNGHLIGLFLENEIPSGKSVEETIEQIHDQEGGLVIVPHPFYWLTRSLHRGKILDIINHEKENIYIDGFEIFNGGVYDFPFFQTNEKARDFYEKNSIKLGAPVAGTDAHYSTLRIFTEYVGNLRQALEQGKTQVSPLRQKESFDIFAIPQQIYSGMITLPIRNIIRYYKRRQAEALALKSNP